jgi:hypothetical protein
MYQTFNGAMDEPGDTQPDSQMFKQYTSGIFDSHSIPAPSLVGADDMSGDPPTDDIDVAGSSQSQPSNAITSPTVIHDDPETQFGYDVPLTSPLKFETPAVAGRRRHSQGQGLSSAMRTDTTPGTVLSASAFFGFGNGANGNSMSLTQAFNATQARTSPIAEAPIEDSVFQRPSPNFTNNRQRPSSPPAAMSSPIKDAARTYPVPDDSVVRSSSEPRADYETLKQSQERRKRELQHEDTFTSAITQDSWEEPTTAQQRFIKRKAKEKLDQKAAISLAGVSAPTPSVRRVKKRGLLSLSAIHHSPVKRRMRATAALDGPNDSDDQDDSPDELSQPNPIDAPNEEDSPDELSQDVPVRARTSRSTPPVKKAVAEQLIQVPNTSSHPRPHTLSGQTAHSVSQPDTPSSQLQRESLVRAPASQPLHRSLAKLKSSRESEVIMNSQPEEDIDTPRPPKALRFPSSPSTNQYSINQTVMQSQTGHTSPMISSSMPPMPPRSSSPEHAETPEEEPHREKIEQGVPSSPPIVSQDEITYDEHAYDEHSEDERQSKDTRSNSEDVEMNDDEDLPVAQAERHEQEQDNSDMTLKPVDRKTEAEEPIIRDAKTRSDDEIPETMEQELPEIHNEEEELIRSSHPEDGFDENTDALMAPPRKQRQTTVPETDMLDETQPSVFPEGESGPQTGSDINEDSAAHEDHGPTDTNSTGAFYTGREQQTASQQATAPNGTAPEVVTFHPSSGPNVRSLLEIANQPNTQRSADLEVVEMPNLSFTEETEDMLDAVLPGSTPARPTKRRKVTYSAKKAFRSPIKETDPLSDEALSSSVKRGANERSWTPPLKPTQENEERGALAAAQAREDAVLMQPATLKSKIKPKPKSAQPQTPRNGALKAVKKELFKRSPNTAEASRRDATAQVKPVSSVEVADADINMRDVHTGDSEADELAGPSPQSSKKKVVMRNASDEGETRTGDIFTPNRVFAAWPQGHFWPATCLCRYDATRYQVRYDFDGTVHEVASTSVRSLDLQPGDQVKLEIKGMKKNSWVVVGFKNRINMDNLAEDYPSTDRQGYTTLVVEEKERDSLPATKKGRLPNRRRIEVQISTIYLTNTIWGKFRNKTFKFTPPNAATAPALRTNTPGALDRASTPTHLKRSTTGASLLRESTTRAGSVTSSARSSGAVFDNMVFAVSLTNKSEDRAIQASFKHTISRRIINNGGKVLEEGFHEMFDVESNTAPLSDGTTKAALDGVILKTEYENVTFVALISDSHSRRAKHCQALALNIPVLHLRWLHDSITVSHCMPFAKYLLPAGVSTFFDPDGVIRSRTMDTYDPADENVSFMATLRERELLFHNQKILLVTAASKKEFEKKQSYLFLIHALGPSGVGRCKDLLSAKDMVANEEWDWVIVDGGAEGVTNAVSVLFGGGKTSNAGSKKKGGSRKRKRDELFDSEDQVLVKSAVVAGRKVNVACDELVIQSLILGALIDEE